MRITFKDILTKLLSNNKHKAELAANIELCPNVDAENKRCQNILNYWLDVELFDLPECPFQNNKDILSVEAELFPQKIAQELHHKVVLDQNLISKDSRLVIMFQCHKAGYITEQDERHPNLIIPRTYLVSHSFIPEWDNEAQELKWSLSSEDKDLIINLSTIRTIYRKCQLSAAENMSLPHWIATCVDEIENLFKVRFSRVESNHLFSTEELQKIIKQINRSLATRFWPEEKTQAFMKKNCQSIETSYENDAKDNPEWGSNGKELTFRWRFGFYPEGNDTQQLGPFFVKDLESCINNVEREGVQGLSTALKSYLLGNDQQSYVPPAYNNGRYFIPLIQRVPMGRWLSAPEYGLSLLQTLAVNVAKEKKQNPIVAVNGPPGTGKTTLLKDIIADRFVHRTYKLLELNEKKQSILDVESLNEIMYYSMIVASSNNKAVENISKELPSFSNIDHEYKDQISHFSTVTANDEWGTFCAVLGNSSNRKEFKNKIRNLRSHLKNVNDIFHLNLFMNTLKKHDSIDERLIIISNQIHFWKKNDKISMMLADFEKCSHSKKYADFFSPFKSALLKIENGTLSIDEFVKHWENLSKAQWNESIDALDKLKSQWFAKGFSKKHHEAKFNKAKNEFLKFYQEINTSISASDQLILNEHNLNLWELDPVKHLTDVDAFTSSSDCVESEFEQTLQQQSPLGSTKLNHVRSKLFCAALNLNEVLIESQAKSIEVFFDDLTGLLDGFVETNENPPEHKLLWSILFLFFPVISTSLSSVENQFKLMQRSESFGLAMIDEAGQAVNYHVIGLLQRCKQVIFVGDPIQLEPVVTIPYQIDKSIAQDYLKLSKEYPNNEWGDNYMISKSSAQSVADLASNYYSTIGERKVGIPLLVHRRCLEPMFSIANTIAYDNKMVSATSSQAIQTFKFIPSGWINVEEDAKDIKKVGYSNDAESKIALDLIKYLAENHPFMIEGGIFIITPFSIMRKELSNAWYSSLKNEYNHRWMAEAFGSKNKNKELKQFAKDNIGTVHTFQGKEASTVILCLAASDVRNKNGGITWVNSKPNLINVAVTRAKSHFFVIGDQKDWAKGILSSDLQSGYMQMYNNFEEVKSAKLIGYDELLQFDKNLSATKESFYFGA